MNPATVNMWANIANLILFVGGIITLYWAIVRRLDRFQWVAKEYPPHKHVERGDNVALTTTGMVRHEGNGR